MKKIVLSWSVVAAVAVVVVGATTAFFSDTETSTGNTFTAGSIDLKVDNECNWSGGDGCPWQNVNGQQASWQETDLEGGVHKFVNFTDLKPGDSGEDTISLHVYDNDAWGKWRWLMNNNADNTCTEPELEAEPLCEVDLSIGELLANMDFEMWLDQGSTPGFQNGGTVIVDLEEGDNIRQDGEPEISLSTEMPLSPVLADAWGDDCNSAEFSPDGHNEYGECHGLAQDGRMVGSTTYYFGFAWEFDEDAGNEAQTDSLGGDIEFKVVQHRNNPTQSGL